MSNHSPTNFWEKIHTYLLIPLFVTLLIAFFYAFSQDLDAYTRPLSIITLIVGVIMRLLRIKIDRTNKKG